MADWSTVASLATAGGTLVLGVATFASVRSANRAARIAEQALMAGLRPLLVGSRFDDPQQKVFFVDRHYSVVPGGMGAVDVVDGIAYLAFSLRNTGSGIAVLDRWYLHDAIELGDLPVAPLEEFRRLSRDIYVAAGDVGFWQGALRDADDPLVGTVQKAIDERGTLTLDLEYGDSDGGQRTITRFMLVSHGDGRWLASAGRHWHLDRDDPR